MARKLLAAAALVLLCAVSAQASRWSLETDEQGRHLLQAAKSPNCSRIDTHCSQCRNQRIPGTRRSELVCSSCESGYRLRRDGISKTCGELRASVPPLMLCFGETTRISSAATATAAETAAAKHFF
jgi:hypothetical protein